MSKIDQLRVATGRRGGGCEIRTREGLHPTRFPTMLTGVHQWPPLSVTCPDMTGAIAGERRRTEVNETETETGDLAARRSSMSEAAPSLPRTWAWLARSPSRPRQPAMRPWPRPHGVIAQRARHGGAGGW